MLLIGMRILSAESFMRSETNMIHCYMKLVAFPRANAFLRKPHVSSQALQVHSGLAPSLFWSAPSYSFCSCLFHVLVVLSVPLFRFLFQALSLLYHHVRIKLLSYPPVLLLSIPPFPYTKLALLTIVLACLSFSIKIMLRNSLLKACWPCYKFL